MLSCFVQVGSYIEAASSLGPTGSSLQHYH